MGIEFSYAAETAFVSPTLLKIGKRFFFNDILQLIWNNNRCRASCCCNELCRWNFFYQKIYSDNTYYIILEFN